MADPNEAGGWVIDPSNPNRATYTDPNGEFHEIFKKTPAVEAPVTAEAPATPERGFGQRMSDSFQLASQEGFGGQVAQKWYDWTDAYKKDFRNQFPGKSEEWYEEQSDKVVSGARRAAIEELQKRAEADPAWGEDQSFLEALATPSKWIPNVAGMVLGSAGPESLLNPGGSALARIGAQGAIGAATDAAYQGLNMEEGIRDDYSIMQNLIAGGGAMGLQGIFEGIRGLKSPNTKVNGEPIDSPVVINEEGNIAGAAPTQPRQFTPEENAEYAALQKTGTAEDILNWNAERGMAVDPRGLQDFIAKRDAGGPISIRSLMAEGGEAAPVAPSGKLTLEQEAEAFMNRRREPKTEEEMAADLEAEAAAFTRGQEEPVQVSESLPVDTPKVAEGPDAVAAVENARVHIAQVTKDWKNAPEFEVVNSLDDLDPEFRKTVDDDAIGVYGPDGKVIINLKNVSSPEELSAVTFHEALGHGGLSQQFGDQLDNVLENIYNKSKGDFAGRVDNWMAENADAYADAPNPLIRAVEEVLAEDSEAGRIAPSVMNQLRNYIKTIGRKMGLDLQYSDREIATILGMSHNAIINGKGRDVIGNGAKYKKVWHGTPNNEPFEAFDHSYMGKGEGNQVFGWGTYLTEVKEVADKMYRERLAKADTEFNGKKYKDGDEDAMFKDMSSKFMESHPNYDEKLAGRAIRRTVADHPAGTVRPIDVAKASSMYKMDWLEKNPKTYAEGTIYDDVATFLNDNAPKKGKKGNLYEVELPDDAKWLDFDKPLSKQTPEVKRVFAREVMPTMGKNIEYQRKMVKLQEDHIRDLESGNGPMDRQELEDSFLEAEEGLARMKQELDKMLNPTGAEIYRSLSRKMGGDKAASEFLSKNGVDGTKYLTGLDRTKGEGSSNYVVYSDKTPKITNRYMKKRTKEEADVDTYIRRVNSEGLKYLNSDEGVEFFTKNALAIRNELDKRIDVPTTINRYMRKRIKSGDPRRIGGVNIENIKSERDVDYFIERAAELHGMDDPDFGRVVPKAETERLAKDLGLTPGKLIKSGASEEGLAARVEAGMQVLVNQLDKVGKLSDKIALKGATAAQQTQLMKEMATLSAVYGRVSGNNSEVGRALAILNKMRQATGTADDVLKYMQGKNNVLTDPDQFNKFVKLLQQQTSPASKAKLIQTAIKPKAEDYIFRLWYNMLLSSPATHSANFLGTGANFMVDLMENTGAAVLGQGKRFSNAERVRGREVAYRMYGALSALKTAKTWQDARKSLNTGITGNQPNNKAGASNVYSGSDPVMGGVSGFIEAPTRMLAGADEWWRNVLSLSNIYGLSVRNAGNKGLKGKAFWNEVNNLINNPTKEMVDQSNDYTQVLQFLDKPSKIAKSLIDFQTPGPNAGVAGRAAAGLSKTILPFVRTPDSLIRTAIRRSPLAPLERENIKGWKAGGAERDKVKARMIMGSAFAFYIASQAVSGNITGRGPSDSKKKMEWLSNHQEDSIKVGDTWYSIRGLEPVSTNITAIATLVERFKNKEITKENYVESAVAAVQGISAVLTENSYLENLQSLFEINSGDPRRATSAVQNFLAGLAASATTPAVIRSGAKARDQAVRDTTGDGSFADRVEGRVKSGVPGLSETLPQKYDIYGRDMSKDNLGMDMTNRVTKRAVETDPTIKEIQRLSETTDKVVLGAPGKSGVKVNGVERRLNAEEYQRYQRLSGYWITELVRGQMQEPTWAEMSDADKIQTIKDITEAARSEARETLFNSDGEEEE